MNRPIVRLYYHATENGAAVWSVDRGVGTDEHRTANVLAVTRTASCTQYDGSADNVKAPRAWIEYQDADYIVYRGLILIIDYQRFVES